MRLLVTVLAFPLAQSLSVSWQENTNIFNSGITSLLALEGSSSVKLFAGDKRGKIHHFLWTGNSIQSLGDMQDEEVDTRPFPIFSITSTGRVAPFQIVCGGGDRYISVWHQTKEKKNWSCRQRLGPHTGWVKDILYDHRRDVLYSIGCNCIESWERVFDDDGDGLWTHAARRSIESSLKDGATLSSDILCLCACDEMHRFFAGGVDGRIHAWSLDPLLPDPLYSIGAHKGRINFLAFAPTAKLLFSSGHDGVVQCRCISEGNTLNKIPDAHIEIMDANGNPARVTAFGLWHESDDLVHFVLGTANGELACFQASIEHDTVALKETADSRFLFPDEPMITAICSLKCQTLSNSLATLAVGHSLGLSLITIKR
jgi:WD40 repeat protein